MAASKHKILRVLSDAHLRAIGKVAAQWSALELTLLYGISQVGVIDYTKALVLAGSQNTAAWCDMLKKLTSDTKSITGKATLLDRLCEEVRTLQAKRNGIVHAAWHPRLEIGAGLLSFLKNPQPKSTDKAKGTGIRKRGLETFLPVEYTAGEILAVAKEIEVLERAVYGWLHQQHLKQIAKSAQQPGLGYLPLGNSWLTQSPQLGSSLPSGGLLGQAPVIPR